MRRSSSGAVRADDGAGLPLRWLVRASNIVLAVVALLGCGSLVLLTTGMRSVTEEARLSAEALREAEAARVELLAYGRMSDIAYLTREPRRELERVSIEADLLAHVGEVRAKTQSGAARDLLREGERQIHGYLATRAHAEQTGGPLQDVLSAATPSLEAALDTLRRLASLEMERVSRGDGQARRWDQLANVIGVTIAVLLVLGFLSVALVLSRQVFAPLLALSEAIDRFAGGDRRTRVPMGGTVEFRRTATSFNDMARRIERQEDDMLTFLAGVAHDLRNPLAALRMSAQYLDADRPLPPEIKVRKTMALVNRQVDHLEHMVGDFLDACRIQGGHLELTIQRADVRDLAREAAELFEASSASHPLVLTIPEEPIILDCDGGRVAQVLNNLVSNAIKYSPNGGVVEIAVSREDDGATICVTDHGIGIARDDLDHIFEPFRRTGASRDTIPGIGLGLSTSRRIAEAHGGRIEVQSEPGVGSTFRVHLSGGHRRPTASVSQGA